ncbi:hypothetical protein V3W47_10645 [Deinococcus sp. YIM 134068]|uniref:hypothetical protein n=1 Tax=Deinococcus lichenicola TaxID=3118910 RepID=UPI002F926BF3
MGFYTIVDVPFPSVVFKVSENNLFVIGLFIWVVEKLEKEMAARYGQVKAEVIFISKFGQYDYHIALTFPHQTDLKADGFLMERFTKKPTL